MRILANGTRVGLAREFAGIKNGHFRLITLTTPERGERASKPPELRTDGDKQRLMRANRKRARRNNRNLRQSFFTRAGQNVLHLTAADWERLNTALTAALNDAA